MIMFVHVYPVHDFQSAQPRLIFIAFTIQFNFHLFIYILWCCTNKFWKFIIFFLCAFFVTFFCLSKELLSFRKLRKESSNSETKHQQQQKRLPEIKVDLIKSESAVTTRTFVNDQVFVETEFLPAQTTPPSTRPTVSAMASTNAATTIRVISNCAIKSKFIFLSCFWWC